MACRRPRRREGCTPPGSSYNCRCRRTCTKPPQCARICGMDLAGVSCAPFATGAVQQGVSMTAIDPEGSAPVLIIEDEDELRDVLLVACELHGRRAIGVAGADEALDRLRGGLRPGLIVFDLV